MQGVILGKSRFPYILTKGQESLFHKLKDKSVERVCCTKKVRRHALLFVPKNSGETGGKREHDERRHY